MFEWMNAHKKNIMRYTLFLVIPGFVLLYGYGECARPPLNRWVAKVNGVEVPYFEYEVTMENLRSQAQQNPNVPEPPREQIQQQALDSVIVGEILRQKANKWGISTTDQEVAESIRQVPQFQDETNTFNYQRYRALLAQVGYSEKQFEEQQRETITRSKVQSIINSSFFRPDVDKQRAEGQQNESVEVEFLAFEPASYTDEVEFDEDGLLSFFEENHEDYRVPEQRRIAYARFAPDQFASQVNVNERELERFFERNIQQYEKAQRVRMQPATVAARIRRY